MILVPFGRNWELLRVWVRSYHPCAQNPSVTSHLMGSETEPHHLNPQVLWPLVSYHLLPAHCTRASVPPPHVSSVMPSMLPSQGCWTWSLSLPLDIHMACSFTSLWVVLLSIVFRCCCNPSPQTVGLKTKEIYSLAVLEGRNSKSRESQGVDRATLLLKALGRTPSLPLPASGGSWTCVHISQIAASLVTLPAPHLCKIFSVPLLQRHLL